MKKVLMCLVVAIMTMLCTLTMFGCTSNVEHPGEIGEYHLVTVIGGTGGGNYLADSTVKVTAEKKEGLQFAYWSIDGEKISSYESYIFKLEGDVTLTANYIDDVNFDDYVEVTPDTVDSTTEGGTN